MATGERLLVGDRFGRGHMGEGTWALHGHTRYFDFELVYSNSYFSNIESALFWECGQVLIANHDRPETMRFPHVLSATSCSGTISSRAISDLDITIIAFSMSLFFRGANGPRGREHPSRTISVNLRPSRNPSSLASPFAQGSGRQPG